MHVLTGLTVAPGAAQLLPLRMRLQMPDLVNDVVTFNVPDTFIVTRHACMTPLLLRASADPGRWRLTCTA